MAGYINPESFFPKEIMSYDPGLGGLLNLERLGDYRNLMGRHYKMNDIDIAKEQNDLENAYKDNPIKDIRREKEKTIYEAEKPYLGEIATTGAKSKIATNQYEEMMKGPEGQAAQRRKWQDELSTSQQNQMIRETKVLASLVDKAKYLTPEQLVAEVEKHRKMGYTVPDQILDPNQREIMRKGLMDTLAWDADKRKAELENELKMKADAANNKSRETVAGIHASATRDAAAVRGSNRSRSASKPFQAILDGQQLMQGKDPNSADYIRGEQMVLTAIVQDLHSTEDYQLQRILRAAAQGNPEAKKIRDAMIADQWSNIMQNAPMPGGKQSGGTQAPGNAKADPLGIR